MEDLLTTWRTTPGVGTPEGELFPRDVRSTIEMGIYGRQVPAVTPQMYNMPSAPSGYPGFAPPSVHMPPASPFAVPTPPPQFYGQPAAPTRDSVITSLLTTLSAKRALLAKNPHDTSTRGTVGILEQLQTHLMAGNVNPQELNAIQQQLDGLRGDSYSRPESALMPAPMPAAVPMPMPRPEPPMSMPKPVQLPFGLPGLNLPIANPTQSPQMPHAVTAPPTAPAAAPALDFSSLLGNLARAGILSQTGTPVPGPPPNQVKVEDSSDVKAEPEEADGMDEYEELILGMNVQLTLSDLNQ